MRRKYLAISLAGFFVFGLLFLLHTGLYPNKAHVEPEPVKEKDSVSFSVAPALKALVDNYDLWVNSHINSGNAPGAAVAIIKNGNILLLKGYGKKNTKEEALIDKNTVFRIASVSKGFAGVLAGVLVEDSLLNWETKVSEYLPSFALRDTLNSKDLALKNILSHTTGLPRHAYTDLIEGNATFEEMVTDIQKLHLIGPVGKYYSYQNVIYSLFSDIAEKVTEQPYEQLMYNKLFKPLGMQNASVSFDSIINNPNHAVPHIKTTRGWRPRKISKNYYNVIPAAGVNASITDMAQWLKATMGRFPEVISEETLQQLYTPVVETPRRRYRRHWPKLKKANYGFGWRIFDYEDEKVIYHGGYVNDYRAEIGFDLKNNIGVVVLTNGPCKLANKAISKFFVNFYSGNTNL